MEAHLNTLAEGALNHGAEGDGRMLRHGSDRAKGGSIVRLPSLSHDDLEC